MYALNRNRFLNDLSLRVQHIRGGAQYLCSLKDCTVKSVKDSQIIGTFDYMSICRLTSSRREKRAQFDIQGL